MKKLLLALGFTFVSIMSLAAFAGNDDQTKEFSASPELITALKKIKSAQSDNQALAVLAALSDSGRIELLKLYYNRLDLAKAELAEGTYVNGRIRVRDDFLTISYVLSGLTAVDTVFTLLYYGPGENKVTDNPRVLRSLYGLAALTVTTTIGYLLAESMNMVELTPEQVAKIQADITANETIIKAITDSYPYLGKAIP